MKLKIEIKNRFTGAILFSFEKENNTVKDTVCQAVSDGANLYGANLVRANLDGANLVGANLVGANLPMFAKWPITMIPGEGGALSIKIGCKVKTIEDWDLWFASEEKYSTKRGTLDFKRIEGIFNSMKAYIETVGKENLFPKK